MYAPRPHALPWLLAALVACGPGKSDEGGDGDGEGTTLDPGTSTASPPTTLGMSSTISAGSDPTAAPGDPTDGATTSEPPPPFDGTTSTTSPPDGTTIAPETSTFGSTSAGSSSSGPPDERVFITEHDGLPGFPCDPWVEDCNPGEKCMPFDSGSGTWDSLKCVPIDARPQQVGEACVMDGDSQSGIDNCDKHAMCWNVNDDLEGTCIGMCEGSPQDPSCPPGFGCQMSNSGVLNVCVAQCDPLAVDCGVGEVCAGIGDGFFCTPDASGEEGQMFDPCEFVNVCDPGLFCGSAELGLGCDLDAAGCCLPHCDLDAPACPQGLDCVPWFEEGQAPDGHQDVGACIAP